MFIVFIVKILGWWCAMLPPFLVKRLCFLIGDFLFFFPNKRRFLTLSNLSHAFPDRPFCWHRKIARESMRRLIETIFFVFAYPHFSEKRFREILAVSPESNATYQKYGVQNKKGGVALIPHFTFFEAFTTLPLFFSCFDGYGAIFRPFDNPHLNRWVKQTRERWGIRLLSRKEGFNEALEIVRNGGWVGILFDLNAGSRGALFPFLGRISTSTILPGMISNHYQVPPAIAYVKRRKFWQGELHMEILNGRTVQEITLEASRWLENYLSASDDNCADWMWGQQRWKAQTRPSKRLNLQSRKDYTQAYLQFSRQKKLSQSTRLWIRLPNWLGDCIMALPLLRVLSKARPDAKLVFIVSHAFIPFLKAIALADSFIALPDKKNGHYPYFAFFRRLKRHYPDTVLLFTNSFRGDFEAFLTGAPQRFGILRSGKKRPLLTHSWAVPDTLNEAEIHQTKFWEKYLRHFGLREEPDFSPLPWAKKQSLQDPLTIGLICSTENEPRKRWPVESWRTLIRGFLTSFPEITINLFGVAGDLPVTQKVAAGFFPKNVVNLAGKTDLCTFADFLKQCRLVISNDTGGMHLANALGVPTIALFGPTNPVRTGPIFQSSTIILRPEGDQKENNNAIENILPKTVLAETQKMLLVNP